MPSPTTKTRQALKSRFVRGAIPTESDFSDLIGAGLNQAEDGVYKLPNEPLSLVRQKPDQPVLRFYEDPAATGSTWQISLATGQRAGLGISNSAGSTSLFIDKATGHLGIGTNEPQQPLHVNGAAAITTLHAEEVWIAGRKLSPDMPLEGKITVLANGNVGIGEPNPAARLTIWHDVGVDRTAKDPASSLTYGGHLAIKAPSPQIDLIDTSQNEADWAIHVNDGRMFFLRSPWTWNGLILCDDGRVGVSTHAPQAHLHVDGEIMCKRLLVDEVMFGRGQTNTFRLANGYGYQDTWLRVLKEDQFSHGNLGLAASKIYCDSGALTGSDIRLKVAESVTPVKDGVDRLKNLTPVSFRYKEQESDSLPRLGFIAQEVEEVLPEAVGTGPDGMKGIHDSCIIALLAQALKEQQAQIDELRARVANAC